MTPPLFSTVAGTTVELGPFVLAVDGVPLPLTDFTLSLTLRCLLTDVELVVPAGRLRQDPDQVVNAGHAYYTPASNDFDPPEDGAAYTLRWQLTDLVGDEFDVPNGEADTIVVYRP